MAKIGVICLFVLLCINVVILSVSAQIMAYPGDCTKYQECDPGGCFIKSCGAGTEFNPAIRTCDYPLVDRSNCGNRG
ncbi:uncharacterized protein [Prorops nasuta]|uniref:uncharacterized protein n=1 Tax=Prorops nasuta TaxID=863751 RepID=UPI0034CE1E41